MTEHSILNMKTTTKTPVRVHIAGKHFNLRQSMTKLVLGLTAPGEIEMVPSPFEANVIVVNFMDDVRFNLALNVGLEKPQHKILYIGESVAALPKEVVRLHLSRGGIHNIRPALLAA